VNASCSGWAALMRLLKLIANSSTTARMTANITWTLFTCPPRARTARSLFWEDDDFVFIRAILQRNSLSH